MAAQFMDAKARCNYIPPTPGYDPCTRESGHEGPCAHPLVQNFMANDMQAVIAMGNLSFRERLRVIWCCITGQNITFQRNALPMVRIGSAQHIKAHEPTH